MTADDKAFLLHPYVKVLDQFNNPVVDANGIPVYARATFTTDTATIEALYASTLDIPTSGLAYSGLQIGGRGTLAVSARNMDLGISHGIRSVGTFLNSSLVPFSQEGNRLLGANLTLELAGDLTMTSSQIASYSGGDIAVTANTPGATLNIGSQGQFSSDDTPKGIYSAHGGNVTVTADGLINVNGSRIGTYDGGDVGVESVHGTVDAGGGARGSFTLTTQQLDSNGQLEVRPDKFFGSGIVALTRPDSSALVGNINVKAHDDILASAGGILQLAFNGTDVSHAQVTLDAGHDIVANQSGVLGANISLHAGNDIIGLVVGSGNVAIHADVSVSANVLGGGNVSVSGGQSVSGSIVGGGAVNVSGSEITASVTSTAGSASTSGDASGAKVGGFQSAAAPVAQQTTTETEKKTVAAKTDEEDEEQKKKRAAAGPVLSKTVGRVTVILPNKQ
jgi:hypothetical protein